MKKSLLTSVILVLILSGCKDQTSNTQTSVVIDNSSIRSGIVSNYSSSMISSDSSFSSLKNSEISSLGNMSSSESYINSMSNRNNSISTNASSSLKYTVKDKNFLYIPELEIKIKLDEKLINDIYYEITDNIAWGPKIDKGVNIRSKSYNKILEEDGEKCSSSVLTIGKINGTLDQYNQTVSEYEKLSQENIKSFSKFFIITRGLHEPCFFPEDNPNRIKELEITQKLDPDNILNSIYLI